MLFLVPIPPIVLGTMVRFLQFLHPIQEFSGFLGLVQDLQRIRNQEANVAKLNDSLAQLEAAFEAGRIGSRLQVDQARQALFNGQSRLLAAKSSYANRLDGYKIFLGITSCVGNAVVDDYIQSFRLLIQLWLTSRMK